MNRAAWLMPAAVLAAAAVAAAAQYGHFLETHRHLWDNSTHDRNAHYLYSLKLAAAARRGHVHRVLDEVQRARVWPPLHGVLAGGVLLAGGLDYRLAVLPSLAGWVGAALLAALLARRALPRGGDLAGLAAALFVLVSPSHRAFATDVMLESLGACLTLLALYAYVVAVQAGPSAWAGRFLGLALTALFLEKYNYWLLALLAVAAAELLARPGAWWAGTRGVLTGFDARAWARSQLRHPLAWVLAALLLAVAAAHARGPRPLHLGGQAVKLYPPDNLVHAAYVVLFLRLVGWWRNGGRVWVDGLDPRLAQAVRWHVLPLAFWLLLPKHPSAFLWYLSLANGGPSQTVDFGAGVRAYGAWAVEDYHLAPWAALAALGLAVVALASWRRLRPGGQVVLCLVLIAAFLTVAHPNRKGRNLHSWLAGGWVAAGVGLGALAGGRWAARAPRLGMGLGVAALGALGWASYPGLLAAGRAPEGGPHPQRVCMLDLVDGYLGGLDGAGKTAVFAGVPVKPLVQWTFLQRRGRFDGLEEHWYGFGAPGEANRAGFLRWLGTTDCDTLVYFDRVAGPHVWEEVADVAVHAELRDLLLSQQTFRLLRQQEFPQHGCRVLVWKKN